jgi:hypothetical protein
MGTDEQRRTPPYSQWRCRLEEISCACAWHVALCDAVWDRMARYRRIWKPISPECREVDAVTRRN